MNEFQERQWIEAARRGDQDAFASLVHLYEKRVMALALRICRSPEDAAEAAQEAFLSAWQGLPFFRGDAAFSTWLYSVSPFSQLRSVTAYKSRPFLSHFILCTFLQRLAVHVVDGVDDAVPVGGVAVFRFHMAPADLAGKSHRADSGSSGF